MGSKRENKYNSGYSQSSFYKSGRMPYWPKKKRTMNQAHDTDTRLKIKYKFKLESNQIDFLVRYLDRKGNLTAEVSPSELNRLLDVSIPDSLYLDKEWWKTCTDTEAWNSNWCLSKITNDGTIIFDEKIEI